MRQLLKFSTFLLFSLSVSNLTVAKTVYEKQDPPRVLTEVQATVAAKNYQKYCVLCHGENREGHKNDHAPSLRSKSLFESGVPHSILRPLSYGRQGTAMGGYLDEMGGPMTLDEVWDLTYWLFWQSGAQRIKLTENPVEGDIKRGAKVFQENCAACHGAQGEGITAPALNNQDALAHNKDEFIRYAIEQGRQDTPMPGFSEILSAADIDNVTAYIRSFANEYQAQKVILQAIPTPDQYVINPDNPDPDFILTDDMYVSSQDLYKALQQKNKMVLLDTRVASVWQRAHIEGAIPFPYYTELEGHLVDLPKDVQIVGYCSCPRAATEYVIKQLRELGYSKTAVLYEGIFGWMNLGYPVTRAQGITDNITESTH